MKRKCAYVIAMPQEYDHDLFVMCTAVARR
jgi:hypothetical protein